jgi:hypothetical protein
VRRGEERRKKSICFYALLNDFDGKVNTKPKAIFALKILRQRL